jgi:hypothetical protein
MSPPLEGMAQRARAKTTADVELIEALGARRVAMVNANPELAAQAIDQHLSKIGRRHANKLASVKAALEDLTANPPDGPQEQSETNELDLDFLNRYERYAEDATSDQLRERWGRVLAAEVRSPGTFSPKVLRSVDEMDSATASLFESFVSSRLADVVPKALTRELLFEEQARLVGAGLLVDPGFAGQVRLSNSVTDQSGVQLWLFGFDDDGIALSSPVTVTNLEDKFINFGDEPGRPVMPVYVLTDTGVAIASILKDEKDATLRALVEGLRNQVSAGVLRRYRKREGSFHMIEELPVGAEGT